MKIKSLFVLLMLLQWIKIYPQSENQDEINLKFGGYVNWTAIYDSRQIVAAREGHFLLYPKDEQLNNLGKDMNAVNELQMAVIQTRLSSKIEGFKFLGAATSGLIEAEFMGNSDNDVNGFRIRHAYLDLKWENISLLMGQYWIPMFITDDYPDQIGSNAGAPFQPFGRNPQLRVTYQNNSIKTFIALISQRDFTSLGPNGSSPDYLKNAILPDLNFNFQYGTGEHLFGVGGEFKKLQPGSKAGSDYSSENEVNSFATLGYAKLGFDPFTFKVEGVYGSNLTDYVMLGGYAVHSIDTLNKSISYTPIKTASLWADLIYGNALQFGLFTGYTKNLGSSESIMGDYYSRGSNIDNVIRIAPRVQYKEGNTKVSLEIEYTSAKYGSPDIFGKVQNGKGIDNLRFYTSVYYFF